MANLFKNKGQTAPVSQRQQLENRYNSARSNLLLVVVFTVINIVLLITKSYTYFLFSASIPYALVDTGMLLSGMYPAEMYVGDLAGMNMFDQTFFIVTIVIAAVILALYLISWIMSKKQRVGWLIFALVFFVIDTLGMLVYYGISMESVLDILFHAWVLYYLISGIIAYSKLKKLPPEEEMPVAAEGEISTTTEKQNTTEE